MIVPYNAENDPYFRKKIEREQERKNLLIFALILLGAASFAVSLSSFL